MHRLLLTALQVPADDPRLDEQDHGNVIAFEHLNLEVRGVGEWGLTGSVLLGWQHTRRRRPVVLCHSGQMSSVSQLVKTFRDAPVVWLLLSIWLATVGPASVMPCCCCLLSSIRELSHMLVSWGTKPLVLQRFA
jgi:hypothetical protein